MNDNYSTYDKDETAEKRNLKHYSKPDELTAKSGRKDKSDSFRNSAEKRRRSSNFHFKEIEDLLFLINSNKSIIECKRTDQLTNTCKDKTWKKIAHIFNEGNTTKRSDKQLRSKWETLKKIARKEYASGNVSPISNTVLKIMLSYNDAKYIPDITCSQTLRLKEEPYFDCVTDQNTTRYKKDSQLEEAKSEAKINQLEREKESSTSERLISSFDYSEKLMIPAPQPSVVEYDHAEQNTAEKCPENFPRNEESSIPEYAGNCLTKATQYDPKDFGLIQGRRPRYVNTHLQNLRRVFIREENRRRTEKHKIEMEILNTELVLKKRQLQLQSNPL